jgi:transglutaminase-like putative cysteine protease
LETAQKIHNWVGGNIHYSGYKKHPLGALYALKRLKGDCTEFMYLVAALCRANKVPARGIGGYVVKDDSILRPNGYHNWVEFYYEETWRLSDAYERTFMKNPAQYIAFRVIGSPADSIMQDFPRFRVKGEGISVRMNG